MNHAETLIQMIEIHNRECEKKHEKAVQEVDNVILAHIERDAESRLEGGVIDLPSLTWDVKITTKLRPSDHVYLRQCLAANGYGLIEYDENSGVYSICLLQYLEQHKECLQNMRNIAASCL